MADLQWNRVSNLQPSGPEVETVPLGHRSPLFYRRNMDRYIHHNILKQNVLTSAEKLSFGTTFTFHQYKHPNNTSKICQKWCLYHVKQQLYDQPQSPDLIPMEQL
ncbi:hypothetical protein AVEN_95768-1 [Araneus ventricosus]|uniref:Uncharacterized protein n=1 Tax=Araneus ventricosus TaxID=182803 RepID=A0A4Y2GN30_ARAVE|nr:hypothetical protein AVEN_95768-1 [Araneus ventricosus]